MSKHAAMVRELTTEVKAICTQAEREGRDLSSDERVYTDNLLQRAEELKSLDEIWHPTRAGSRLRPLSDEVNHAFDHAGLGMGYYDPGKRFVESEGFKSIQRPEGRSQVWSTGLVKVTDGPINLERKGTLMEAPGSGGGAFTSVPYLVPGVVSLLFQPLSIENALSNRLTDSPTVRYIQQGTATSGAAGVPEGGTKPESLLGFSPVDEPIRKVATTTYVSEELIADSSSVQQFINGQLVQFVNIETERQLLRGSAGGNEVQGLLTSRGVPVYSGGTAAGDKSVQLFRAANSMRGSAFLEPGWFIISPSDYEQIRLLRDNSGQYYGGGPYGGAYGAGSQVDANNQVTGAVDTLWTKPVYVSNSLNAGTALVGTRSGAEVWNRSGISVEITNAGVTPGGLDLFSHDLLCIRAERRLGLACYRPRGYVEVHLS